MNVDVHAHEHEVFGERHFGDLRLRNPLLMAPVKTGLGGPDGTVGDAQIAYYARRARGEVGGIIVEPLFIDPRGKEHPRQLGAHGDHVVAGLTRLVDAIHGDGARAIAHLNHAGRAANPKAAGQPPEAPSAVPCPTTGATPEVLPPARVEALIAEFGDAARRVAAAGFDAIELQYGLGYLIAQFLSPRTNLRDDAWGGDLERRRAFGRRVLEAVRAAAPGLPIVARLSATEKVDGGLDADAAVATARWLADLGVDALHVVSGSACDAPPWYYQHMSLPAAVNAELTKPLRAAVSLPLIAAGRLGDPATVRALLKSRALDLVALGRPLVADPDLPAKLLAGHDDRVIRCGACLQGCLAGVKAGRGIGCIINPEAGREGTAAPVAAGGPARRVVVIGGGAAGLMAARVAAERGHEVTVFERADHLGGQLALAHLAPGKEAMRAMEDSFIAAAEASGATLNRGVEATPARIRELGPDVLIVATGAEAIVPDVPGIREVAVSGLDAIEALLTGARDAGATALVLGGGLVGVELAETLSRRGTAVTVVEQREAIAGDMEMITRKLTMRRLAGSDVRVHTRTTVTAVDPGGRHVRLSGPDGERREGPFDTLIIAAGTRPAPPAWPELETLAPEVHVVGDARELGQIEGALRSAWEIARTL